MLTYTYLCLLILTYLLTYSYLLIAGNQWLKVTGPEIQAPQRPLLGNVLGRTDTNELV